MVENVTSLTSNGMRDWLIQRITAVILGMYVLFLVVYLFCHSPLTYADWHALFTSTSMRIFSFLALLSMVYHTWIGLWTVFTDYIKCYCLRLLLQVAVVIALLSYLVWGVSILWGL